MGSAWPSSRQRDGTFHSRSQLFVAGETSPGKYAIVQTVKTGDGARTMDLDPTIHRIYLPAAEYETGANGRQAPKPGTFVILVVAPQGVK